MRDRRQTHKIRSEYGATTALMLMVALLLLMLTGMVASEVQRTGGGASAQVIATDDVATEGGLRAVTGLGSTSHAAPRPEAGNGAGALQTGTSYVRRASDGDADAQTNVPEEVVEAEDSSTPTSGDDQDAAGQADESDTPSSDAQNPADAAQDADQPTDSEQPSQPSDDTQSSQGQTDGNADSDSKESQPTADDTPQQPGEKTLEKKLTCVNGTSYTVTLTYDATANIPDNAQLKLVELNRSLTKKEKKDKANKDRPFDTERFVSASALDKRGEVLDRSLKLTDSDYRYFTKYVDILLVADGKTITPAAPVDVTIQTKAISQDKAGTLELALMVDVDKPTKKDPYAYKPLGGKNETEEKESTTKVSFTTDELGEFALAGVAYSMGSWDVDGMTVNVMGPRDLTSSSMPSVSVEIDEEGLELRDAFNVKVKPAPKYGTTLWISATPSGKAQDSGKVGGLYGYRVWRGMLADRLFDPAGTKKPVEFASDDEGIALVWDAGYRQQSLTMRKVTVKGMMPQGVSGSVTYVNGRYDDLASVSKKLVKAAEAKGAQLKAVAAYDINLTADGAEYRPTEDNPVTVSIASIYIKEGGIYDVWRVQDDGTVSVVEDATQDGDTMTFEATSLEDSYVVVETTVHTTLEASNGQQYRVTVTYDNKSGIPENATLAVREIEEGQKAYATYVKKTAAALGERVDNLAFARAFDITLVDPKTGKEYQPNTDVQVSIELLSEDLGSYDNVSVVHIPDGSASGEVVDATVNGETVEFATDGFSVYVVTAHTVQFHRGDYTYRFAGEEQITLSALLDKLGVTQITINDVESVSFSIPDYMSIEQQDSDWLLRLSERFDTEEELTLTLTNGQTVTIKVRDEGDTEYVLLQKDRTGLEGSWATWQIDVNPGALRLNGGEPLTLTDNFNPNQGIETQSIDYASINVTDGVTYDYRGSTGTFVIPDESAVTITYRTRIKAQPGEVVESGNVATLLDADGQTIATATVSESDTIYPSASDVATNTGVYMIKLLAYGNEAMQDGIAGVQFVLLDATARPMTYKKGAHAGEDITFTTGENGYADIQLDGADGDVSIQKNTAYYLEMIRAPEGYKKDTTLYSFMITDDPDYNSGGVWTYYNGDTMKVRLYPEEPCLNVSLRFSGNYSLDQSQLDDITAILQRRTGDDTWEEVERHAYTDFNAGTLTFDAGTAENPFEIGQTYRVIQENERPWDLPGSVMLNTTHYLIIGSGDSENSGTPIEFTIDESNINSSINVVINDEYQEPELKLTKMDKQTGDTLPGAVFTVKRVSDDEVIRTYTTDTDGVAVIAGGPDFESETLYYAVETEAPEGYLLPLSPDNMYFYFCNDPYLEPSILEDLPEGETAINLSEDYDVRSIDNQREKVTIPVMKTWQGNTWPTNVGSVTIGLYQSVGGEEPQQVLDQSDAPRTVVLTRMAPYNNRAFTDLPARDESNRPITYSIVEEAITSTSGTDLLAAYVKEYGISDSGVYIVRNKLATTLTVNKEWYDLDTGQKLTSAEGLAQQPEVFFDVYRATEKMSDEVRADGITNVEMADFIADLTKVRNKVSLSGDGNWSTSLTDLDKYADSGDPYLYYVLECVPSFGNELYEVNEEQGTVLIKNKTMPQTVSVTVRKAALVNDPRPESSQTDFNFTLSLKSGNYVIRNYQLRDGLTTDWNGEASFTLKPEDNTVLTLPVGVTATITEAANPEYVEVATGEGVTDLDSDDQNRTFQFGVEQSSDNATVTFTNTLRVICKVVDINNVQHPYESLKSALAHVRENPDLYGDTVTVQMLEDYTMPATDVFDVQPDENIILTTASTTDPDFPFRTDRTEQTDTAIITRGGDSGSMLTNEGVLTLGKITLDGGGMNVTADGDIVNSTGELNMTADATLQNAAISGMGGAIYSTGTINMPGGTIRDNSATSGSAIYLAAGTLNLTGGHIEGNISETDGAVAVYDTLVRINISGDPTVFGNENTAGEWANIYLGADSDNVINVLSPGLDAGDGLIGVRAAETHREIGEQFASAEYGMTDNLNRFINDFYEYRGKLKEGTSTNVVWDGLSLTIRKSVAGVGAYDNDRFTITLSSTSIKRSTYSIQGTIDFEVTMASSQNPGKIELRNVKDGDEISISPLPVGSYTIEEATSNYSPAYAGEDLDNSRSFTPEDGAFTLGGNSAITVTNTRRLADVTLTKTLEDRLKAAGEVQDFGFTVGLTEADGTPVSGFALADGTVTGQDGTATFTLSPSESQSVEQALQAPVGATMTITETDDPNYTITTSAQTGAGSAIEDQNTDDVNAFAFPVTDDGADVSFANVRKMAEIQLRKNLFNKVSANESFTFTVTLTDEDSSPVANYPMYVDAEHPENNITTDGAGTAGITFAFTPEDGTTLTKAKTLTIPEGTRLVVAEIPVTKDILGTAQPLYDTTYSVNEGAATTGTTATIATVSDNDHSIVFNNTRKTRTITVSNTVNGYSGNVVPFTYTATVTDGIDGNDDDYDVNGFEDGEMTFELTTGQSQTLVVPYGASLTVTEGFVVGYETKVKRGSAGAVTALSDTFVVTQDMPASSPLAFTNKQLIGLRIVNNTSSTLENVTVTVEKNTIYRVNSDETGQELIGTNNTATFSVAAGETAILEIEHEANVTAEQNYSVSGAMPSVGYYYTIINEPSFHEYAEPAILHVYDAANYQVAGMLRYSVEDSTVTFTEQPLMSFDANGGSWTTEMDGYRDRDGDRKVYQKAVTTGEAVERPTPDPVYPTAEQIEFLGWTTNEAFAKQAHTAGEDVSAQLYDFETTVTVPVTLYAIWARDPSVRVITVKNGLNETLTISVELTNSDASAAAGVVMYEDTANPANTITTDNAGQASFSLAAGATQNLRVPQSAKLVITASNGTAYSVDFTDGDNVGSSFTINSVTNDGTVSFIGGICKITDADGNVLYENTGNPAVYSTLAAAFTAYVGNLYAEPQAQNRVTPTAVKMLIDEYVIAETVPITFPNATMTFTTASASDASFPYVGVRGRSVICRSAAGANALCFRLHSGTVTLTDIVLDGGSERGVKIARTLNGGLINVDNASGILNIESGTTLRNCEFAGYTDTNNSRGGAIYLTNGTLNVRAGLFTNLHAYYGGAVYVTGGMLNVTGTSASTRFERCYAERQDGGAIYYSNQNAPLVIDGGSDVDAPGITFTSCEATYRNGNKDTGDGGAIYADTTDKQPVTISGCNFSECSAKTEMNTNAAYGGGAICANHVKGLTVSYCKFTACDTLSRGGALVVFVTSGETVAIDHSSFERCNCKGQGGAVAVYQPNQESGSAPDIAKSTKLTVSTCSFDSCSSGTNNGSGGAIQCYVPCMEFTDSSFTDCWAGKEGGAVNNYFANGYTVVWSSSYMTMSGCRFIRCRAEDRYDTTALQHYGGAMNTKVFTATIANSYFEDCVSTLKEGGALHLGGQTAGSKATVTGSTFKNCTAKNGGGALLSSHETLEIDGCFFYGCSSSASNGGAVYHYRNSRGDSTQKTTTIKNSTFGVDPDADEGEGCNAAQNGGAIWTRATTEVTLESLTIDSCTAANNGGGVYLDAAVTTATVTDGTISGNQATNGSAVYVGKTDATVTFSGNLYIHDNTVSNFNDAAIHGGKLYFEGNVKVEDNTCSSDPAYDHDVLMQYDGVATIFTTAAGLASGAHIGVYVPDRYFNKRGLEGQAFGTYGGNAYLDSFFNDRNDELFGYQMSNDDTNIYWGIYVCKITDADGNTLKRPNGRDAIYQRLTMAFDEFTSVTGGSPVYVKMLVEEYNVKQTSAISNFPAANVTLTTASRSDGQHPYRGTEGTVCTISRTNSTSRLFNLNVAGATFQLQDITLDGRRDKTTTAGSYGLIELGAGTLTVNHGTTLQHCQAASNGGGSAIYAPSGTVVVNGSYDAERDEATVKFIGCTVTGTGGSSNGGAIYAANLTIGNGSNAAGKYGTSFVDCTARRGGAIYISGSIVGITGASFDNCYSASQGGAIYHNNTGATATTINNSAFRDCYTNQSAQYSYGGAVGSNALTLTVDGCRFESCYALSSGGAINHGLESNNRTRTSIINTTFDGCYTTGTNTTYALGGSVYTQAKEVVITSSNFNNSTSTNHGGALYCSNGGNSTRTSITGSRFENCSSTNTSGGYGGAVYSSNKTLNLGTTTITNCIATGTASRSGAVYMATSGSTFNVNDGTVISNCYANQGGAIYLAQGVTMTLSGSPEFSRNGYTNINGTVVNASAGACIYVAEGSTLNLSGSPVFSRNNITDQGTHGMSRVANGGTIDYVRQDIYLAGYSGTEATSIRVTGELTGGTIWVWPEKSPHRLPGEKFAIMVTNPTISDASLQVMRNALADGDTGCSNGEYLAGVRVTGDATHVYWDKMYNVSFIKKDNKGVPVPGAEFTLYKDSACTVVATRARSANGKTDVNARGELLAMGVVDFPTVTIGAYYMKETIVPESFKADDITYLVLVGSPSLQPTEYNTELWTGDGPLNVENAATIVQRLTVDAGKYFGIFPLGSNGKADLSKNLVNANVGIINMRKDFDAWFMKADAEGRPLPNATFTLYEPVLDDQQEPELNQYGYPEMVRWHRDGEDYPEPVTSADGTTAYKRVDGSTVEKGVVYFRELPIGTYYLIETAYPVRNGNNRLTYFVEGDRVFRLDIRGVDANNDGVGDFELSEWNAEDREFLPCDVASRNYVVRNQEAVCKLTDDNGTLLYELGKLSLDGKESYHPAIYPTLEEGFDAAQDHGLYSGAVDKQMIGSDSQTLLKLQVLKDFTLTQPVTYSGPRGLTFTTASRTATSAIDRYVFTTTRTTDTSRAEVKRAYNADASADPSADPNDVALITVNGGASLTLQNINLNGQKNTYDGRAIHVTDGRLALLDNAQVHNFKQSDPMGEGTARGGAILMDDGTALSIDGGTRSHSAVISDNQVAGDGGAIAIGEGCVVDIRNAQLLGNKATDGNGGALYVASGVNVPLTQGTLRGNEAALGSAVYLENGDGTRPTTLTMNGGSMTGNRASASDGGAINVGGADAIIAFEGSPTVFNNVSTSNSTQQRNVVLGDDTNDIIRTTGTGLTGGLIGVYVTGEISEDQFQKHGLASKPFGTFGADRNLQVFRNDRNLALYGTKNDEGTIDWVHVVCKLTDANDNLLYQETVFTINGSAVRCKAPAIYPTVQEGFDAVAGGLYSHSGAAFGNTSNLKLKMLQDVELETGVQYAANNRAVTFTTAETQVSVDMSTNDDYFVFQTTRQENDEPATTALVSRGYDGVSLITATGKSLTLTDIVLDGAKEDWQATAHGGLVRLSSGQLVIASGATLQTSRANGNGGAVYAASGTTVSVEGGTINRNECTAEYNGAGIYIDGATIRLSGNPYFGGSGVNDDGDIVTPATDPHAEGNWKQGAAADGLTNGTAPYAQYRQDIFVHGMTGNPVANIVLAGNLGYAATGEFDQNSEGSIWTWVDDTTPTHHKDKEQFAVVANGATVSEQSYSVFRNARDDAATDNSTGKYLSGVSGDAIEGVTCVYWGPSVKGARRVILRKVTTSDNATFGSLVNATFTVYSGSSITKVDNVELKDLISNANGVFWIGDLPYGTYYLHETAPTDRWFTLTVGDDTEEGSYDGVVMSPAQTAAPRERP